MAFRLARVLRLRSQLRQQAQDEMATARAALTAVREQIAAARASQDLAREAEVAAAAIGLTADELLRFRAFEQRERTREQMLEIEQAAGGKSSAGRGAAHSAPRGAALEVRERARGVWRPRRAGGDAAARRPGATAPGGTEVAHAMGAGVVLTGLAVRQSCWGVVLGKHRAPALGTAGDHRTGDQQRGANGLFAKAAASAICSKRANRASSSTSGSTRSRREAP
jgi:hypothetical protein